MIELRTNVLNTTIDNLVLYMDWKNEKYYQQIVNGYRKNGILKYKNPTIDYLFSGLNFAMKHYTEVSCKKEEIKELIFKYIIKF